MAAVGLLVEDETRMRVVGLLNCGVIFEGKLLKRRWDDEVVAAAAVAVGEKMEVEETAIWGRFL